jgi:nitrile hydratase beta subunit
MPNHAAAVSISQIRLLRVCYGRAVPAHTDMGGRTEFFGPVIREADEPVFHERWEGRVFGISFFLTLLISRNLDTFRFAIQKLPRDVYLSSYYRRWLGAFEDVLEQAGYLAPGEVDARIAGQRATAGRSTSRARLAAASRGLRSLLRPTLRRWFAAQALPRMLGTSRPSLRRARFAKGDHVQVRDTRATPFTRQPGYVTGKPGVIVAHHGSTVFPDSRVVGRRAWPQHLYTVSFKGADLWGDAAEPGTEMRVDLYESYLEAA